MLRRDMLVLEFWDRSKELNIKHQNYRNFVRQLTHTLLDQDTNKYDLTTNSLIRENKRITASIIAKENGIFCGLEEFTILNHGLSINPLTSDGDKISKGDVLIKITGDAKMIFERERTSLNLLQRMSGISTLTNNLLKILDGKIKLAATRKTFWGRMDKKAVSVGGGLTHRLGLSDGVLIKDNHLRILGYDVEKALQLVKNKSKYIEIEVENRKQALAAANAIKKLTASDNKNMFAIMLDNIKPAGICGIIKELKNKKLLDSLLLEASGNINPGNMLEYADSGLDIMSMGYLTNSSKVLNLSQEIE